MNELAQALGTLGVWVRLHYVYPYPHVDEVIPLMAEGKILPYLDVPFQHASPRILKLMKRPRVRRRNLERIRAWRAICPDITLRSTFIVGFPGETEAEFEELLDFLEAAELDRVGCFAYSPVDGAAANALPGPYARGGASRSAARASCKSRSGSARDGSSARSGRRAGARRRGRRRHGGRAVERGCAGDRRRGTGGGRERLEPGRLRRCHRSPRAMPTTCGVGSKKEVTMAREVVVVSGVRTAIGDYGGGLKDIAPTAARRARS